jgi:hypothetical protein
MTSDGQPRIALSLPSEGGAGGLYYIEAPNGAGPFAWTRVDTLAAGYGSSALTASLALDHWSDEPRVAYAASLGGLGLRYAYRAGGVWTAQTLDSDDNPYPPVEQISLAITPGGDPRITRTQQYTILVGAGSYRVESCRSSPVASFYEYLYKRAGAEGAGAFSSENVGDGLAQQRSSARGVVAGVADGADLVWRDPAFTSSPSCPYYLVHAADLPTTGVPPETGPIRRFAIGPNPLVAGRTLAIHLAIARAGRVELTLVDIAGRRVAGTEARPDAGASSLVWTPEGLRAGVYRVIARADGVRIGSAALVVLR